MSLQQGYAVRRDGCVESERDLDPSVRAILARLTRVAYVADQHRLALVRLSLEAAKLRGDLERIEGGR
ncbi:MAG: hypothetical protein MUF80_07755 [Burkholderiales bacterium]|jgi:hypothetical protein|nr:hypothetical protein [Burkholderiales bacterium]